MHAAIYDAVNSIDGTHKPYLVRLSASHFASQEAAAAAAAHEVLVKLYPSFQATLDTQFQQALAQLPKGGQADGISIGKTVADRILALRANDGSNAQPIPHVFGNAREITNRPRRISLSSPNSRIGLALHPLPWRPRTSFGLAVHQS